MVAAAAEGEEEPRGEDDRLGDCRISMGIYIYFFEGIRKRWREERERGGEGSFKEL